MGALNENRLPILIFALALTLVGVHLHWLPKKPDIEKALDSVVVIRVDNRNAGTGFFFTDDGCMMTAAHVIEEAVTKKKQISVMLRGVVRAYPATVIGGNSHLDVAVLCADVSRPALRIVWTENVKTGDDVWVVGHPMSRTWNMTQGVISRMSYKMHKTGGAWLPRYDLFTTAFISWGNSGGPVLDRNGNVIGMIVEWDNPGIDRPSSINIATPGTDLLRFLRSLWGK